MVDFKAFLKANNFTQIEAAKYFNVTQPFISQIVNGIRPIPDEFIDKLKEDVDIKGIEFILDEGHPDTGIFSKALDHERKLIPFYDDVASINDVIADIEMPAGQIIDFVDAGDWFRDATAATRYYGESMPEYPTGCILALKEVLDRELVVPGRDYTIETSEYRVTKRLQKGKSSEYISAYSTNKETYPDGRMVHEPFDIPWRSVQRIYLVIGYVVRKNGGTILYRNQGEK